MPPSRCALAAMPRSTNVCCASSRCSTARTSANSAGGCAVRARRRCATWRIRSRARRRRSARCACRAARRGAGSAHPRAAPEAEIDAALAAMLADLDALVGAIREGSRPATRSPRRWTTRRCMATCSITSRRCCATPTTRRWRTRQLAPALRRHRRRADEIDAALARFDYEAALAALAALRAQPA